MGNRSGARGARFVGNLGHAAPVAGRTRGLRVAPVRVPGRIVRVEDDRGIAITPGPGTRAQAGRARRTGPGRESGWRNGAVGRESEGRTGSPREAAAPPGRLTSLRGP